jgi:hypothetical protein
MRKLTILVLLIQFVSSHAVAMRPSRATSPRDEEATPPKFKLALVRQSSLDMTPENSPKSCERLLQLLDQDKKTQHQSAPGCLEDMSMSPRPSPKRNFKEVAEAFLAKPGSLARLLERHDVRKQVESLFTAYFHNLPELEHTCVPQALQSFFEEELRVAVSRGMAHTVFREATGAVLLTRSILCRPGTLQKFRLNFIHAVLLSIAASYEVGDPLCLGTILADCIDYFALYPKKSIPKEVTLILNKLKVAAETTEWKSPIPVLLGSLFILRFIVPALAQPDQDWVAKVLPTKTTLQLKDFVRALKEVGVCLQLISNQQEPSEEHLFYGLHQRLHDLQEPTGEFLMRFAEIPEPEQEFASPRMLVASESYL